MDDEVRAVKERTDIVDTVGGYVKLRRAGRNYVGLCPFHNEKSPSFSVSRERSAYYCFGCGVGGDVFSFLMQIEGWSFVQTLEVLAERTGITLTRRKGSSRGVLEAACGFFRSNLDGPQGASARAYLERRGVPEQVCADFELGWAPMEWRLLHRHLSSGGADMKQAEEHGLIVQGERGFYDRFRGRLIFPIRTETGALAGFGGRLVEGEGAKYINSSESSAFSKKRILYPMHMAKRAIRDRGHALVVEGYMDAIRAHMHGYRETVASMGTALTDEQADMIARFCDKVYICFDTDSAGREAAIKGMYTLHRKGLEVRVVAIPAGKDPDELLSSEGGAEAFRDAVNSAMPLPRFHVAARRAHLYAEDTRKRALEDILHGLASLSTLDLMPHLDGLASDLNMQQHELKGLLREYGLKGTVLHKTAVTRRSAVGAVDWEASLCALLWMDSQFRARADTGEMMALLCGQMSRHVVVAIMSGEEPDQIENRWRQMGEDGPIAFIASGGAHLDELHLEEDAPEVVLSKLRQLRDTERYGVLYEKMLKREELTSEEKREYLSLAVRIKKAGRPASHEGG